MRIIRFAAIAFTAVLGGCAPDPLAREPLYGVVGRVVDEAAGAAVADVAVTLRCVTRLNSTRPCFYNETRQTWRDGGFSFSYVPTGYLDLILGLPRGYVMADGGSRSRRIEFRGTVNNRPYDTGSHGITRPGFIDIVLRSAFPLPQAARVIISGRFRSVVYDLDAGTADELRITELVPGPYTVTVVPPTAWQVTGGTSTATTQVYAEGSASAATGNRVEFQLEPLIGAGEIAGLVHGDGDELITGAEVEYRSLVDGSWAGTAVTDAMGQFRLSPAPPGPVQLELRENQMPLEGYALLAGETAVKTVTVRAGAPVPVAWRLTAAFGSLEGRITDNNFRGVEGVLVILSPRSNLPSERAVTNSMGEYSFPRIRTGLHNLRVHPPLGYVLAPGLVETAVATVRRDELHWGPHWTLIPTTAIGSLRIRVTAAGRPVPGTALLLSADGVYVADGRTDSFGNLEFSQLLAGTYTLTITPSVGYDVVPGEPRDRVVTVRGGESTAIEWQIEPPALPPAVFEDNFDTFDRWTPRFLGDAGGLWTQAIENRADGGNPGGFRLMSHTFNATTNPTFITMFVEHYYIGPFAIDGQSYSGGHYDPSSFGAITAITFSEDRVKFSPPSPGTSVAGSFIIEQGVVVHEVNVTPGGAFNNTTWESVSVRITPESAVGSGLDFSRNGSRIRFGYRRGNSSRFPVELTHGVDNFRVVVQRR